MIRNTVISLVTALGLGLSGSGAEARFYRPQPMQPGFQRPIPMGPGFNRPMPGFYRPMPGGPGFYRPVPYRPWGAPGFAPPMILPAPVPYNPPVVQPQPVPQTTQGGGGGGIDWSQVGDDLQQAGEIAGTICAFAC
jgi:hypothetical protein